MSARRPARARDAVTDAEPVYWLLSRLLDRFIRAAFRLSIVGGDAVPRTGPGLLAADHLSRMDPVVLIVALHRLRRRLRFLAVEEVFHHPVAGAGGPPTAATPSRGDRDRPPPAPAARRRVAVMVDGPARG